MLEKKPGVRLIPKLRAILLKEADHNLHDGFVFGSLMLDHARENGLVPEEQLAEKAKTAEDGVWIKVLKADYARLRREALGIIAADAANCYDMVNHIILALLLRAIGIPFGPIISMLLSIKLMRYYLRTGFGESKRAMRPEDSTRRRHGLNQGSRAAPPCWTIISSMLVEIQRAQGHIATVITPITRVVSSIVGFLYVDDTDLYILREEIVSAQDLLIAAQEATDDWCDGLFDTGGGAKPEKSVGHLFTIEWDDTGDWYYNSLLAEDGYELTVPTREGREACETARMQ
jgi:hypothetical protein